MATVETSDKIPEWMLLLEKKTNRPHRLAHEIGAGAPCLACGDKCPGLDLHFWRKLCRNCKCKKEDHDVIDDDGRAQFEILLGAGSKRKKPGAVLKLKVPDIKTDVTVENKTSVPFDWVPPNVSEDIAAEYMQKLPAAKIPISGSDGALYRRQQLERQMPLHDLDATHCHNLTPQEIEELQKYLDNLKSNVVGQGRVDKVPTLYSEQRLIYRVPTLQHPSSQSGAVLHSSQSEQSLHSLPHLRQEFNSMSRPFRPYNSSNSNNDVPPPLPNSIPPDNMQFSFKTPGSVIPSSSRTTSNAAPLQSVAYSTGAPGQKYPASFVHNSANETSKDGTVLSSVLSSDVVHSTNIEELNPRFSRPRNDSYYAPDTVPLNIVPSHDESNIAHSYASHQPIAPDFSTAFENEKSIPQDQSSFTFDKSAYVPSSSNFASQLQNQANNDVLGSSHFQKQTNSPIDGSNVAYSAISHGQALPHFSQPVQGSKQSLHANITPDSMHAANFQTFDEPWSNPSQIAAAVRYEHSVLPYDMVVSSGIGDDSMPHMARIIEQSGLIDNDLATQMELLSAKEHPVMSHLSCKQCSAPLIAGEVAVFADRAGDNTAWHPQCFICHTCDELLVDLVYFFSKGNVYCGRHFAELLNIPRCFACDELVFVKEYTVAEGKTFHVKHFCCYECDVPLAGKQYVPADDQPTCLDCYQEIFGKKCHSCRKQIAAGNQRVTWKELNWHTDALCFRCNRCSKSLLGGRFVMKEEQPYCNKECVFALGNQ